MQIKSGYEPYPITLTLSLEAGKIHGALIGLDERLEIDSDLPPDPADYWWNLDWVAQGGTVQAHLVEGMVDSVVRTVIPTEAVQQICGIEGVSEGRLLVIQMELNNSSLERFPWELLGQPGAISPTIVNVAVWRRVPDRRPDHDFATSSMVMVAGSTPINLNPPHTHPEAAVINSCLKSPWISLRADPSLTINDFRNQLKETRPAIVHIIAHSSGSVFSFQATSQPAESARRERAHHSLHYQELAKQLDYSPTARLAVLSACHSADVREPEAPSISLGIAETGVATIGMATFLPPNVGVTFTKGLYGSLALGSSVISAYYAGVDAIRRDLLKPYSLLWSIPVLYSTDTHPNVIIFPTDERARARRELCQIEELAADLDLLEWEDDWSSGDWAEATTILGVRLADIKDSMSALRDAKFAQSESLSFELSFTRAVTEMEEHLATIANCLDELGDPTFDASRDNNSTIELLASHQAMLHTALTDIEYYLGR